MDEYLFITMAKLKADRLRLEREQRAQSPAQDEPGAEPVDTHKRSARTSWFSREPEWSKQS
ncbi:MAG: hypothetical protein ABW171_02000 [Steroidobacter sp.]